MSSEISMAQLPKKVKENLTYTTASGLQIKFLKYNSKNTQAKIGSKVAVHYTGKLTNDTVFDSSYGRGKPISFSIGAGSVIKGWEEGIAYMHEGDSAILTIPPALGYGESAMGSIPANSTLIFEVKLVSVNNPYDCTGKDTVTTASGLKYVVISKGRGIKVDSGMNVTAHYTGYFEDGKIFDSSVDRDEPITIPIGSGKVIKGWDEGITCLHVGDKAKLFIPYTLAYGEVARGPIPAKSNLIFDVEILKAEKKVDAVPYDVTGKDTLTTASGLKYIIVNAGTGEQAASGKTVKVHYSGYFLDGSLFDSSVEMGTPIEIVLGQGQVIKGWDEGITLLKAGTKARLIIPYQLGYGENAYGPIPAKSTLVFDVELIEVK
ncbi:MAG TPA: FKBP-type peptidyl-prolyl cis-trans isomerase [Bacteroidales bacterium]|nr:FKBP-type peptidyl-prolyl cis-trans isomerase [Bacteroidales bacterium]